MDKKLEHLKMIQTIITRMNTNSFQIKGWTITLISALLALYANSENNIMYIGVAIIPTVVFWFLDSYYLKQEKKFRALYDDIIKNGYNSNIKEFSMPIEKYANDSIFKLMFSTTICPLYLTLILGLELLIMISILK